MQSLAIVIAFDVGEQVPASGVTRCIAGAMDEFRFQTAEEAFHRGVIPAVAFAAHRLHDAIVFQSFAAAVVAAARGRG